MLITRKVEKIFEKLMKHYKAMSLIHQLFKLNEGACICGDLKYIHPTAPRFYNQFLKQAEKSILSVLLYCPLMQSEQLHRLLHVVISKNRQRTTQKFLKGLHDKGLIKERWVGYSNKPGSAFLWKITPTGYRTAMRICFPKCHVPDKIPEINLNQWEHSCLIAEIFCALVLGETPEATSKNIETLHWYPPHKLAVKYDPAPNQYWNKRYKHLYPDAIISDKSGAAKIFLEVDRDTKSISQEYDKLRNYIRCFSGLQKTDITNPKLCKIFYSVPSITRGEAILAAYNRLKESGYNAGQRPSREYFEHTQTAKAIREWLDLFDTQNNKE